MTELDRFRQRVEILERLESFPDPALTAQLESENHAFFQAIREQILLKKAWTWQSLRKIGDSLLCPKAATLSRKRSLLRRPVDRAGCPQFFAAGVFQPPTGQAYDYLDELVLGILQYESPSEALNLDPEMVPYQPTPARHILDLLARTRLTAADVLIDLGSGLGQVALLTAICTPARVIGIELDPAYVHCATQAAQSLNLETVTFVQEDARQADLSTGTVFYLYTPFKGAVLRTVLDNLRQESKTRKIRVCTFGPCTPIIAQEAWLIPTGPVDEDRIALFHEK